MGSVGLLKNSAMVCAPLMAPSVEQLVHDMLQAKAQGADLVEIRLDAIHNFQPRKDLPLLLNNKPLPVLILYRPIWEGNQFEDDAHKQLEVLRWAKELGADYVELDLNVLSVELKCFLDRPLASSTFSREVKHQKNLCARSLWQNSNYQEFQ